MKRIILLTAVVVLFTVMFPVGATAQCSGFGGGWSTGWTAGSLQSGATTAPDALKKFNTETKNLQMQLIDKQALLQKEWLKDDPNLDTIGSIQKNIIDIQINMQKIAKKLGVPACPGSCSMFQENCRGGGNCRGMGRCIR